MTASWQEADHYASLGLSPDATDGDVVRAFRRLARTHHPDTAVTPDPDAFQRAREAYEVLGDAATRRRYDQVRARATKATRYVQTDLVHADLLDFDLAMEDVWLGLFQATMSTQSFGFQVQVTPGDLTDSLDDNPFLAMNPWWQLYRTAWRMAS